MLRSLGVTRKDTVKIFSFEALIICITSLLVGIGLYILVIYLANYYIKSSFSDRPFDLFYIDYLAILITVVIMFLIGSITSIIPIRTFSKKKLIDIIKIAH